MKNKGITYHLPDDFVIPLFFFENQKPLGIIRRNKIFLDFRSFLHISSGLYILFFKIFHISCYHKRNLEGQCILENANVQPRCFLKLL